MLIDCDGCAVRDLACGDCVVTVLLGPPGGDLLPVGQLRLQHGDRGRRDLRAQLDEHLAQGGRGGIGVRW